MKVFSYYALHTFKNQLKKLFKTWVLIFVICCFVIGIVIGTLLTFLEDSSPEPESPNQTVEETEPSFFETMDIEPEDLIELLAGGIVLVIFVFYAVSADKNGSRIFLPADVNLLFASPMKPQSVLMFRLATQLGLAVLGSVYMLFQLPNLIFNVGISAWAALSLVAAWGITVMFGTLIQVLLYTLSSTHTAIKRFLRPTVYGILLLIAGGFAVYFARSGEGWLKAAVGFFNAPLSRAVPIWGWIHGLCAFALRGNLPGAALCFFTLALAGALLIYVIWNIKADFYEDAMAKSQETAELLERAQSEKSTGFLIKRDKDRSDKLRRDGMRHGAGANVFFFKSLYNRFRFAHLGFFTKTMEFYLAAAVGIALLCRFVLQKEGVMLIALTLAVFSFFRSLGNPLEQDAQMDCFLLIPESTWAKLFWSLMGGTANCFLDVFPAMIVGALITGTNLFASLAWIPLIVSVDFFATNVGAFIGFSVPVAAGKTLKQIVQILFIYFGLVPDIVLIVLGIMLDRTVLGLIAAAVLNFGLGLLFFGISPIFIDPKGGRRRRSAGALNVDLKKAGRQFSTLGMGAFAILAVTFVLQLAASGILEFFYPQGGSPSWALWLYTFAPMYLAAVPVGLLIMRRAPAAPCEKRAMRPGRFVSAALISIFAMYAGSIVGSIVLSLIQLLSGATAVNPVLIYATDDSLALRILVMVILAPLIEEYVFRKQFIDRTRIYGERLAVFTSALIFGLFHGNLSQFFYAFALGLILGYVYLKTGRLRYSAALHMMVNFLGSVLAPAMLESVDLEALNHVDMNDMASLEAALSQLVPIAIYALSLFAASLTGLVLFCVNIRRVSFDAAPLELPKGSRLKTVYLNVGMILLIASCLALTVLNFTS